MTTLSVILVILMALDALTTGVGLAEGIRETNPLFRIFPASFMFGGKVVIAGLVLVIGRMFEKGNGSSRNWGKLLYVGLILLHVLVVGNNLAAISQAAILVSLPSPRATATPAFPLRPTLTPSPTLPACDFPEETPMTAHCDGLLWPGKYCEVRVYPWWEGGIIMVSVSSSYGFQWWREWPYGQVVLTPIANDLTSWGLDPWGFDFLTVPLPCRSLELATVKLYALACDHKPIQVITLGSSCQVLPLVQGP